MMMLDVRCERQARAMAEQGGDEKKSSGSEAKDTGTREDGQLEKAR
jgi:hypothetical protein